jgi:hypothetical protein
MKLYLDDDSLARHLIAALRRAGHDVELPHDVGLSGRTDPEHFTHCIQSGRIILSGNYRDFELLHILVSASGGHHPGVLVVRKDNSPRDMSPSQIVRCIEKLRASGTPVPDQYVIINHWR